MSEEEFPVLYSIGADEDTAVEVLPPWDLDSMVPDEEYRRIRLWGTCTACGGARDVKTTKEGQMVISELVCPSCHQEQ